MTASASKSTAAASAKETLAQKDQVIQQLKQQLLEAGNQQPAELDDMAKRKLYAQNRTVLYVTHVEQSKKHGGVDVCAKLSCNVGIKDDAGNWVKGGKWVDVTSTWFTAWDEQKAGNFVADDLLQTFQDQGAFRATFYWQWNSNEDNIIQTSYTDKRTGKEKFKDAFEYTPGKKIFAFDLLESAPVNRNDDLVDCPF
jgi:hypothetical protein